MVALTGQTSCFPAPQRRGLASCSEGLAGIPLKQVGCVTEYFVKTRPKKTLCATPTASSNSVTSRWMEAARRKPLSRRPHGLSVLFLALSLSLSLSLGASYLSIPQCVHMTGWSPLSCRHHRPTADRGRPFFLCCVRSIGGSLATAMRCGETGRPRRARQPGILSGHSRTCRRDSPPPGIPLTNIDGWILVRAAPLPVSSGPEGPCSASFRTSAAQHGGLSVPLRMSVLCPAAMHYTRAGVAICPGTSSGY